MRTHAAELALATTLLVLAPAPHGTEVAAQRFVEEENDDVPVRIELRVGEVHSIPADGVQSYSSSGPLIEVAFDATKRTLDVHLTRAGSSALLVIFADGTQRRYDFVAR